MQLNWNTIEFAGLAGTAAMLLLICVLIGISAARRSSQMTRLFRSIDEVQGTLHSLQTELAGMKEDASRNFREQQTATGTMAPAGLITADQRAGALEMFRNGAGAEEVAGAMGISGPEAALLQKVQRLLVAAPSAA